MSIPISAAVVIIATMLSLSYYSAKGQEGSDWLVTSHFNPTKASLFTSQQTDSWAVTLASPDFSALSEQDRLAMASDKATEVWRLATGYGYSKKDLVSWFEETAKNYSEYPIKKADLMHNQFMTYRDFSFTKLPRPNKHVAVFRAITGEPLGYLFGVSLWITLAILVSLYLLAGVIVMLISKNTPLLSKIVVAGVLVLGILGVWLFKLTSTQKIVGESLFINEIGPNDVFAKGSWRGVNQKIANPLNSVLITCSRSEGVCREAKAELSNNMMLADSTTWEISSWDEKEVIVDKEGECTTVKMVINFKDKAVTQIRTSKDPLPADCIIGASGKLITELADGFEIAYGKLGNK